jgi:large subunit ribosomal protein L10
MKNLNKKINLVSNFNLLISNSSTIVVLDFSKIKSIDLKILRQKLTYNNLQTKVIKNTLAKKALNNTIFENIKLHLVNQNMFVFSHNDISLPVKILNDFIKTYSNLKIKIISIYGKLFDKTEINEIINIPKKEYILVDVINKMNYPIINFIKIISFAYIKFYLTIKYISKNK